MQPSPYQPKVSARLAIPGRRLVGTVDPCRRRLGAARVGGTTFHEFSLHNRFGTWVADLAGVDLTGAAEQTIGIGGTMVSARTVTATLQLAEFRCEAPVSFCQPWPFDFQLLVQQGFLRWFTVDIDTANETLDIVANTQ